MLKRKLIAATLFILITNPLTITDAYGSRHHHSYPKSPVITPSNLIFRDDFINLNNWKLYDSVGHDGNGIRSPYQIKTTNGIATITGTNNGTTGGMSLRNHDVRYGTVAVRLRAPAGAGVYHPVALLWGLGSGSDVNAVTGEIDFTEFWNRPFRDLSEFTLHYGDGSLMVGGSAPVDGTQWHTYATTWTPTYISGSLDGIEYYRVNTTATTQPKATMELCLQLDWFPYESTTKGSATMEIDWIEIRK